MSTRDCRNDMSLWRIVRGFVGENRLAFSLYVVSILTVPIQDVLLPHLAGLLYKAIRSGKDDSTWIIVFAILGVIVAVQGLDVVDDIVDHHLYPTMQQYVRDIMLYHQFRINSEEYRDANIGETVAMMNKLPGAVYGYIEIWKNEIVPRSVALVVCAAYIAWACPPLGLLLATIIAVVGLVAVSRFRKCCSISDARDSKHSEIVGGVDDVLSNMRTVIGFQKESEEIGQLAWKQKDYARLARDTLDCTMVVKYVSVPLMVVFVGALAYVCLKKNNDSVQDHIKLSLMIVGFIVCKSAFDLFSAYKEIVIKIGMITNAMTVFEECPKPRGESPSGPEIELDPSICIMLRDVTYSYPGARRPIFDGLNLSFERGKATAVVGDIGSGKSTLISLLMGFQRPDSGRIYLDGVPYENIALSQLRRKIFLLPQTPTLMNRSVFENIAYGVDAFRGPENTVTRQEITDLVASLGLGNFIERVGGFDASAGVRGGNLSGGQRQIVWILKLFLADPEVAVLDEPTASLDPDTKALVARLVIAAMNKTNKTNEGPQREQTIILSTHDRVLAEQADVVLKLERR